MLHPSDKPIGIFDSGVGGLTVVRAIQSLLPEEDLIYFGDTAHMPYGDKSASAIQAYSIKICNLLLSHDVKVIVIACNTASAASYDLVKEYVGSKALVLNVIDPMVQLVSRQYRDSQIGLIATKGTVNSNIYLRKIDGLQQQIRLQSLATPLLAPMIEEGYGDTMIIKETLKQYLADTSLAEVEALILGCTHYPLIKNLVSQIYEEWQRNVSVLDSSQTVAKALEHLLGLHGLLRQREAATQSPRSLFYVSDYTESFAKSTKLFFGEEIALKHYPLWD